jgi:phage terminase large subunit-like protein
MSEELQSAVGRGKRTRLSKGEEICRWIEGHCFVPEGRDMGKPVKLSIWQRKEIVKIYDNPSGTRRAILSFARKNGKTALAAMLLLANVCGPYHVKNSQLYSAAQSREQASLLFNLACKMIRMSPDLRGVLTIKESAKEIHCLELGTKYRALAAEATTAYGLSPVFIVHDELGQVKGPRSILYEALETATGAQSEPLSVIISTQARTDADLLSVLIDDALAGHDPRTLVSLYAAPPELDPFDPATIKLANPALGEFLNEREVMAMAKDAERMPSREAEYRNLVLNQRVEIVNPFIQPAMWKACSGEVGRYRNGSHNKTVNYFEDSLEKSDEVYAGLDLSEVADLTAFVMIGRFDDEWHVDPTFWLPHDGLDQKAIKDRVPYDQWASQGLLMTTPGKTVAYKFVADFLRDALSKFNIRKVGFDRWNMRHLQPWLLEAGMSEQFIKEHFVEFGQGVQSMSPALRDLEELILSRRLVHHANPILTMCVANTVIVKDDAGNRKPSKRKSSGRIDGLVALAMAVGVAPLNKPKIDVEALIG